MEPPALRSKVHCNCSFYCGGPEGPGRWIGYSTRQKHLKKQATPAPAAFSTSSTSTQSPIPAPATQNFRKRIHTAEEYGIDKAINDNSASPRHLPPSHSLSPPLHSSSPPPPPSSYSPIEVQRSPTPPIHDSGSLADIQGNAGMDDGHHSDDDGSISYDFLNALPSDFVPSIDDIRIANKFIDNLRDASLQNIIEQLRCPLAKEVKLTNPDHRLSVDIFLSITTAAEKTYNSIRSAILRRYPESEVLTYYKVKSLVRQLSGVTPVYRFTGPFAELDICPYCGEFCYEPDEESTSSQKKAKASKPRKQFCTIPIGSQLQALWRSPKGAQSMDYRKTCTEHILKELDENEGIKISPYEDFFNGSEYLKKVLNGDVGDGDVFLLYRYKKSECWIYIWVILDHSPDTRYKKHAPKNSDSFIFPGLYHLSALQKEGLHIWNADTDEIFLCYPHLALVTADGPAMAMLSRIHCRFYCPIIGRHKPGHAQYYPAPGCDHDDVDLQDLLHSMDSNEASARYLKNLLRVVQSSNQSQYEKNRLATGIVKPSIFSLFAADIMHLFSLNSPDLMIPLWRGKFDCEKTDNRASWDWAVLQGNTWKEHGKAVASCTPYMPGSFDRPPRNPAEKINSGYKAWEFLLYFYGLGPCLFFGVLPDKYWEHYCKSVRVVQLLTQNSCNSNELNESNILFTKFSDEFESLYVQRRTDRIHFVRPSIHTPSHIPFETIRVGPGAIYSQWTMERTIGNLGEEIKQHANPYANISQHGVRRCQVNALVAAIPDLIPAEAPVHGSREFDNGYIFLAATDTAAREVCEALAQKACSGLTQTGPKRTR
ncbi:MAG: hypothetical protein NXY57DRAFT_1051750 [Lentinula lateritia]|nr:MAG: hypothetical protein NXY57DRAFT_1051750 [Lentinula lateritia]